MGKIARYNGNPKKIVPPTDRELTTALFLLRCKTLGFSIQELESITVGMVYDMISEKNNDDVEYDTTATVDDINRF